MKNREKRDLWGMQKLGRKRVRAWIYNRHKTRCLGESKEKKKRVFF